MDNLNEKIGTIYRVPMFESFWGEKAKIKLTSELISNLPLIIRASYIARRLDMIAFTSSFGDVLVDENHMREFIRIQMLADYDFHTDPQVILAEIKILIDKELKFRITTRSTPSSTLSSTLGSTPSSTLGSTLGSTPSSTLGSTLGSTPSSTICSAIDSEIDSAAGCNMQLKYLKYKIKYLNLKKQLNL